MIEINHIVKKYGPNLAVDDISFSVGTGEIVGFLGPNGAGKSTTMNILTGYLSATEGTALIDGIDILENPIEAKRRIGFLPEQPPLYLEMTVKEYLNFVYDLKRCTLNRKAHIEEICEVVKIKDVYGRVIKHLSKGYRQRVGIAQALIGNPPVLIFDEPTVGLDPKQIIEIRNLIKNLGRKHTVILSTHILPEVQAVCDRIIIIDKGKLVANELAKDIVGINTEESPELGQSQLTRRYTAKICGNPKSVLSLIRSIDGVSYAEVTGEREEGSYGYIIEASGAIEIRKPLFYALCDARYPLIGLETETANLEDVFISLTGKNNDEKEERSNVSDIQA